MMHVKLVVMCLLLFGSFNKAVAADARLSACTMGATSSVTLDGSSCESGLQCSGGYCVLSNEIPCVGTGKNNPCGVGKICASDTGAPAAKGSVGVCISSAGGVEDNAFGQLFCNAYSFITGKVGRGLFLIAVVVTGVTFFMGKIQFTTLVITACGVGFVFGAPAIVSVFIGKGFSC